MDFLACVLQHAFTLYEQCGVRELYVSIGIIHSTTSVHSPHTSIWKKCYTFKTTSPTLTSTSYCQGYKPFGLMRSGSDLFTFAFRHFAEHTHRPIGACPLIEIETANH